MVWYHEGMSLARKSLACGELGQHQDHRRAAAPSGMLSDSEHSCTASGYGFRLLHTGIVGREEEMGGYVWYVHAPAASEYPMCWSSG